MDDSSKSYDREGMVLGAIFPQEPGAFLIEIPNKWRTTEEDVVIEGVLKYGYGDEHTTKFKLQLFDDEQGIEWRNSEAT